MLHDDKKSELSGEGLDDEADKASCALPSAGQPETRDVGHALSVSNGRERRADVAGPELQGEGQRLGADKRADEAVPSALQPYDDGKGLVCGAGDGHGLSALPSSTELPGEGHSSPARKGLNLRADSGQPNRSEEGRRHAAHEGPPSRADLASTISAIRYHHRTRVYSMEQRKRADLSLGAFLRMALGWSKALPEKERKKIADQAQALISLGEMEAKGKPVETDEPAYAEWRPIIMASLAAREPFDAVEGAAEKEMDRIARTLPVWSWFEANVFKKSGVSLAVIVGEAGDLSAYPKKGHLWKRMGLAVMGVGDGVADVRQGGLPKGAKAEAWIAHGYSAKRRSRMFVIGDVLVKGKTRYRKVYLDRKDKERAKTPDAKPIVLHRRAQRYMEKIMLRDLWVAWRRATV